MAKQTWERVGGGQYDVYRPKKKSFWERVGEVIGGMIVVVAALAIIGAIAS
ncbi:hypothetical protein KAJ83_04480 [Marivibrio halodurans]|uniref:Uncharacterized protein n=1 Tax=Marivibrio halodurans TaxID=2039722 RepID=A0A8J7S3W3_9PROT|nr:hypothetical protein [Marivibrio halodurans]MBP5856254.1 hypothetical protein [Marivibrio halodurans]